MLKVGREQSAICEAVAPARPPTLLADAVSMTTGDGQAWFKRSSQALLPWPLCQASGQTPFLQHWPHPFRHYFFVLLVSKPLGPGASQWQQLFLRIGQLGHDWQSLGTAMVAGGMEERWLDRQVLHVACPPTPRLGA